MKSLIALMVILPILCGLLLNLLHKKDRTIKILALTVAIILPIIPLIASHGAYYFGGYPPITENPTIAKYLPAYITGSYLAKFHPAITYIFNSAQRIFIFILGIVAFLAIFTSLNEVKKPSGVYSFLMFMATAAVTAILLADDIFNLYVFFEIAAISQAGIILSSNIKGSYKMALRYLFLGSVAAPMLLLGVALLLGAVGNVNISDMIFAMKNRLIDPDNPIFLTAAGLIIFGWLYGSGLPPFHTIKSGLYSKALPHAASLIQAFSVFTLVALGIIILRLFYYIPVVRWAIIIFSIAAMALGISMAIMQTDFKRLIGFLAVGELGYIGIGLGLGTAMSITAGLFQAVNEALVTACLFLGFGTILYQTGTSEIDKLGGLLKYKPGVAGLMILAGFIMAGIPPFNVFQSKLMLIESAISAGFPELAIIMILLSIVTFMTFMKAYYSIYLKPEPRGLEVKVERIPSSTILSMIILLVICTILGILPQLATSQFGSIIHGLLML